jgi:hypothetical protein
MFLALKEKYIDLDRKNEQGVKNIAKSLVQLNTLINMRE